jgi:PhnB protein
MKLNPFLNYGGNCEQALRYYEHHLGGKITMLMRRAEQPDQPMKWPGWESSIQYAEMEIADTVLMASDVSPERFQPMRSVYLSLTVESAAEAERVWAGRRCPTAGRSPCRSRKPSSRPGSGSSETSSGHSGWSWR